MQPQKRQTRILLARLSVQLFGVVALTVSSCATFAQDWQPGNFTGDIYHPSGHVGIGAPPPDPAVMGWRQLYIRSTSNTAAAIAIDSGMTSTCNAALWFNDRTMNKWAIMKDTNNDFVFHQSGIGNRLTVKPNGFFGIGTANPQSLLSVNGTITAQEVNVTAAGWSDYVFAPDYRLRPLEAVEQHIATRGTLPGIPSEQEVRREGVAVGEMQAKLLEKIEELTLYAIQLNKENERLKQQNNAFERRLQALEQRPQ